MIDIKLEVAMNDIKKELVLRQELFLTDSVEPWLVGCAKSISQEHADLVKDPLLGILRGAAEGQEAEAIAYARREIKDDSGN